MEFQTPKGTRDFLPQEMIRRQFVIEKIQNVFEKFGFEPFNTPAFEEFELLSAKSGEDVKRQIYDFEDKGGRRLGLRFDLTVPMARVVASNPQLAKPFKRYAIAPVWRYEEVTAARKREFWQCDADVVGSSSMEADAECIAAAVECFKELGFKKFKILLNNRKILEGFVELLKIEKEKSLDIFRVIDKIKKCGEATVESELNKIGLTKDQIMQLIGFMKIKKEAIKFKEIAIWMEGFSELAQIKEKLEQYGFAEYVEYDFSLARGLDYYTGPIFEIFIKDYEKYGSVAGGGRYDTLIETFGGRPTAATGISLGIERIMEIMEQEKMFKLEKTLTKVFVASVNEKVKNDAIKIVNDLRKNEINCQIDLMNRSLGKQLEYADSAGIPFVAIVGEKELKKKKVMLRNMKTKKEKEVLIYKLKENLR
jgi:histidyl-tRNA synthetase